MILKGHKMVLGKRKAAGWTDREKSGLSSKEAFRKAATLGGVYSPMDGYLVTQLEGLGQVNKL